MVRSQKMTAGVVALMIAVAFGAGCGSSNDNAAKTLAQQEQLRQARADAARTAVQAEKLRELQAQVKAARKAGRPAPSVPSSSSSPAPAAPAGGSCGGGVSAGPATTCGFALNVKAAYDRSGGGNASVVATSPTTGKTYTMFCAGGAGGHVCTGGNNASVSFP